MEKNTLQLLIRSLKGAVAALEMEFNLKKEEEFEKEHINQKSS